LKYFKEDNFEGFTGIREDEISDILEEKLSEIKSAQLRIEEK
jgi:hypothetical protein